MTILVGRRRKKFPKLGFWGVGGWSCWSLEQLRHRPADKLGSCIFLSSGRKVRKSDSHLRLVLVQAENASSFEVSLLRTLLKEMSDERSQKFQKSCASSRSSDAAQRALARPKDEQPPRRSARPECLKPPITLEIPDQTRPDPSDLPEHIDRRSPCSMLEDDKARPALPIKAGSHPHRPQVTVIIPDAKQPDPSDHPEHCDGCVSSPGLLLGSEDCD